MKELEAKKWATQTAVGGSDAGERGDEDVHVAAIHALQLRPRTKVSAHDSAIEIGISARV